jgi:hypothetical protein
MDRIFEEEPIMNTFVILWFQLPNGGNFCEYMFSFCSMRLFHHQLFKLLFYVPQACEPQHSGMKSSIDCVEFAHSKPCALPVPGPICDAIRRAKVEP